RIFSGDRKAYNYLPESVHKFPDREQFLELLSNAGFSGLKYKRLTGGIVSVYTGLKF
ncbi:MAG: class I SAM-dependent methyltransferase, partial [Bacteroidales bacterium]|nr:class I SAM-dependent methyltransferase [Bacteroidales bacterium]